MDREDKWRNVVDAARDNFEDLMEVAVSRDLWGSKEGAQGFHFYGTCVYVDDSLGTSTIKFIGEPK